MAAEQAVFDSRHPANGLNPQNAHLRASQKRDSTHSAVDLCPCPEHPGNAFGKKRRNRRDPRTRQQLLRWRGSRTTVIIRRADRSKIARVRVESKKGFEAPKTGCCDGSLGKRLRRIAKMASAQKKQGPKDAARGRRWRRAVCTGNCSAARRLRGLREKALVSRFRGSMPPRDGEQHADDLCTPAAPGRQTARRWRGAISAAAALSLLSKAAGLARFPGRLRSRSRSLCLLSGVGSARCHWALGVGSRACAEGAKQSSQLRSAGRRSLSELAGGSSKQAAGASPVLVAARRTRVHTVQASSRGRCSTRQQSTALGPRTGDDGARLRAPGTPCRCGQRGGRSQQASCCGLVAFGPCGTSNDAHGVLTRARMAVRRSAGASQNPMP
ncbi:hypothetical protein K491DRAFT_674056 [Lophiostoma macrostomum CBS 122681]|uniref:Uncharacterized protein n=1 Tax=Lophiostoma macrostomum CBS 122681 TaxID=1314788 RepID=A0A6A6TPN3_9PLEO|nr:hypothetical protein K491DRAFT_674056 [Lophiostoma macrostomum CBS 122681]